VLDSQTLEALYPPDSYTTNSTHKRAYWADLSFWNKLCWVNRQVYQETRRELRQQWRMFKKDPLSPVSAHISAYVITGLGLFVEGYTLFSIGNLSSLFKAVWPHCWKTYEVCSEDWINAVNYLSVVGIICGQVLVGIEGDWIGRRFGMVQNALVMTLGSIMLMAMWATTLDGWVIFYAWSLFLYGLGVGGEYPMTSSYSMEGKDHPDDDAGGNGQNSYQDRLHRGRKVSLAFLMQGWGQFVNQLVLILLLLNFQGNGGDPPYHESAVQWVFRVQFGLIVVVTLWLAYMRCYKFKYQDQALKESKANTAGYDIRSLKQATGHYWHRIIGTAGCWFCNDFFFYGNKIFAGVFIGIITGGSSSVMTSWWYSLINISVSLVGYYMAALLMDYKMYGRKWMQANGFLADFILFFIATLLYDQLTQPGEGVQWFQFIYFFSSFWNQFGPNCTTFLLAGEVYPTSIRATAHGLSAAVGKLGALVPTILYNYIDNHTKFWVVTWFGLAGWVLTMVFVPDTTGLDLQEQERYWRFVREGCEQDYHGVAVHPRHLSLWERIMLRRHRRYNPELDRQQRLEEIVEEEHSKAADLLKQLNEEKERTNDSRGELDEEQNKREELTEQLNDQKNQLTQLAAQLEEAKTKAGELEEERSKSSELARQLDAEKAKISDFIRQIEEEKGKTGDLERQLNEKRARKPIIWTRSLMRREKKPTTIGAGEKNRSGDLERQLKEEQIKAGDNWRLFQGGTD